MERTHTTPAGYRVTLDDKRCTLAVMGEQRADGYIIERRDGPRVVQSFALRSVADLAAKVAGADTLLPVIDRVADIFADSVLLRLDLMGQPLPSHKPESDAERRLFTAAWSAGQKVRACRTVVGFSRIVADLRTQLYAVLDLLATGRDAASFHIYALAASRPDAQAAEVAALRLSLAEFVMKSGGYIPRNAIVDRELVVIEERGPAFLSLPDRAVRARDAVIDNCFEPPF